MSLDNCDHVYVRCAACNAVLLDLAITEPSLPAEWKVKANCPFCGDESFVTRVKGGFYVGGYGRSLDDDAGEDDPSTKFESFDVDGDVVTYKVIKAKPDAVPLYR